MTATKSDIAQMHAITRNILLPVTILIYCIGCDTQMYRSPVMAKMWNIVEIAINRNTTPWAIQTSPSRNALQAMKSGTPHRPIRRSDVAKLASRVFVFVRNCLFLLYNTSTNVLTQIMATHRTIKLLS